ncbi:YraN family protein [Kitasatospora sp. NA04385]|uniref:YraN family protein n=1 Tax=Kitasatospora sp. NA04385 TaxID=2742135 RepID=UPI0020CB1A77|nr:YraN family protein [Kitasatospora sp. NA04385]
MIAVQNPNKTSTHGLGRYGEEVAARRLAEHGLCILERNWRCASGELDIVALDGDVLAICEVKTRSERGFQQPAEAIDQAKADRLRHLAERWLAERWPVHFSRLVLAAERAGGADPRSDGADPRSDPESGGPAPPPPGGIRIDLVAVVNPRRGAAAVEHLRGAV